MKYIGAHVPTKGGVSNAPLYAMEIGARAFALFTKNQRQWKAKPLEEAEIDKFKKNLAASGISPDHVLPHDSYLINLGTPKEDIREKSLAGLLEEARRVEMLGLKLLNFHPGAHSKLISETESLDLVVEAINSTMARTSSAVFVIETTAGQGTNIGYTFEHLKYILDRVDQKERAGVCIDTCHIFAAGYDLRTKEAYEKTMDKFAAIVGFEYLKGVHLNDSKKELGSRVDRHDSLGKGLLGLEPFKFLINDSRFDNIPLILETVDDQIWPDEIQMLYSFEN